MPWEDYDERIEHLMDLQDRLDAGEELSEEEMNELLADVFDEADYDDISLT